MIITFKNITINLFPEPRPFDFTGAVGDFAIKTSVDTNAIIANKVKKYIYAGTACSYPKSKQSIINPPPLKEEDVYPAQPESAYGWSKLMGEYEAELAYNAGSIDIEILRLHNVYGSPSELDPASISLSKRGALNIYNEVARIALK